MVKLRKLGIVLTSSALSLGMFSSVANASPSGNETTQKIQIQVAASEKILTKNDLIKRFKELFPKQFDDLTNSDFQMSSGHYYSDDKEVRYNLFFNKMVNGKSLYGSVGFVGEELEIETFYFQPSNEKDALFPAKVSKDEARKIADEFMKKFLTDQEYQLETDSFNYYPQQILTEPIRYNFSFSRTKNKVSISDQRIEITVLGNGEVTNFYKSPDKKSATFEDTKQILDKNNLLKKLKDNISVELQYQIDMDYRTGEKAVKLVYQPSSKIQGVHAVSGKWLTPNGYSTTVPEKTKVETISAKPLPPKQKGVTLEEAKKIAEKFIKSNSDKLKLSIQAMDEVKNYNGQNVIRVDYTYEHANGGYGTSLEINKDTGEIIQYYDISRDILQQNGEKPDKVKSLTQKEALTQALKYVKEMIPSYLHNYALPVGDANYDEAQGSYHFSFPRVVKGIMVMGDQINVSIARDGSLNNLNVDFQEIESWPSLDKVISEKEALVKLKDALSLKLAYMKPGLGKENRYDLVYQTLFNENIYSFLDATTGEWNSLGNGKSPSTISHPWAEEELNYLISAKVLEVKDTKNFNGDAAVSKGEALKVILNSLTYFYEGMYYNDNENKKQTFDNIDPKHPLYQAIERAVDMGVIKPNSKSFDVDTPITREELAAWYIRVLGQEQSAKYSNIYKLDFADADKVQKEYTGYVAIANSIGLFKMDNNQFHPSQEVTYAELAVSTILLAHEISENRNAFRY
ncbi:YcdB/YcdC domain-containing protein [Psychrobacillus sp. NPDC058041]|uniref:YcdB/YcdC domain-containing protein n=1 Tax=Psychrobacillus sp. NPDC058041 TaxID=3346310 RepID=UPI0036D7AC87